MDKEYDYQRQKNGWVRFGKRFKKKKLRKYIAEFTDKLVKYCDMTRIDARNLLIEYYNKDGLKGVHRVMSIKFEEIDD